MYCNSISPSKILIYIKNKLFTISSLSCHSSCPILSQYKARRCKMKDLPDNNKGLTRQRRQP
jgi:hypothetical protein